MMRTTTLHLSRRAALGGLGAACILPGVGLAGNVQTTSGRAFCTTWRIVAAGGTELAEVGRGVEALFWEVDRTFSPWRADSAISRFNVGDGGSLQDPDLAAVTETALGIARQSGGAFDPTVGPLVARWGFGPIRGGRAPDWRGLSVSGNRIARSRPDLTVDLCGIAKGWALDRAARLASDAGVEGFLFDLGGEFVARGRHPQGRDWRVAVETPPWAGAEAVVLTLPDGAAVATSGVWQQGYDLEGRRYSHIIDPGAGMPVDGTLGSVTVVAEDAMTADGWATALCAAGAATGPALAEARGLAALFQIRSGDRLRRVETGPIRHFVL